MFNLGYTNQNIWLNLLKHWVLLISRANNFYVYVFNKSECIESAGSVCMRNKYTHDLTNITINPSLEV